MFPLNRLGWVVWYRFITVAGPDGFMLTDHGRRPSDTLGTAEIVD